MLAAFHTNLTALSWIALIVGLFLVYNTVTISVVARRQEIGTLRALGLTRRKVLVLFLGEAAVLAVAGIALGLALARLLADVAVGMTASTVSTIYIATVAAPPDMNWSHVGLAVGDRPAAVAAGRRRSGARSQPRAADGGDARARHARDAVAAAAGDADRAGDRARASPTASRSCRPVGRPPDVRLRVVVRHRDRRRAAGAGDHVRAGAASAAPCCAAASASRACSRTPT